MQSVLFGRTPQFRVRSPISDMILISISTSILTFTIGPLGRMAADLLVGSPSRRADVDFPRPLPCVTYLSRLLTSSFLDLFSHADTALARDPPEAARENPPASVALHARTF